MENDLTTSDAQTTHDPPAPDTRAPDPPAAAAAAAAEGAPAPATAATTVELPVRPGVRVGRYELLERLGAGGMGEVWRARPTGGGPEVAVKLLDPGTRDGRAIDAAGGAIAPRDALPAPMSPHPHVVTVIEAGVAALAGGERRVFVVLELVEGGEPITAWVETHDASLERRIDLLRQTCRGVRHVHGYGVLHQDVKAGNVLVGRAGVARVVDFGVAVQRLAPGQGIGGTPGTMSPEQIEAASAGELDQRSDVWSLAALAWHVIAGRPHHPALGARDRAVALAARRAEPPSLVEVRPPADPAEAAMLRALDEVLRIGLAFDRERRFGSCEDLERALATAATPPRPGRALSRLSWEGRTAWAHLRRDHPRTIRAFTAALVVGIATIGGSLLAGASVAAWPDAVRWYAQSLLQPLAAAGGPAELEEVAVLTFGHETAAALRGEAGLEILDAVHRRTYRVLHAAAIDRLVDAGARAIVLDLHFPSPSPWDETLAGAIRRAKAAGVPVVVGVERWRVDPATGPAIAPGIAAAEPAWGGLTLGERGDPRWVSLGHFPGGSIEGVPSLSLATVAAVRHHDRGHEIESRGGAIRVRYFAPSARWSAVRPSDRAEDLIEPTTWTTITPSTAVNDAAAGDVQALHFVAMPDRAVLERATRPMAWLWSAPPLDRRDLLADRVVLVRDRAEPVKDGWRGGEVWTVALEALLRHEPARGATWATPLLAFVGAVGGLVLVGRRSSTGGFARAGRLVLLAVVLTGAAMLVGSAARLWLFPAPAWCAIALAALLAPRLVPPRPARQRLTEPPAWLAPPAGT